ncbi:copper chaperone PCu(A)C [Aquimarina hainanensis]|uniref:Copper chaperone PCu(A)C n=1 Tax=Aquimarina hainanensis TaxID=1578017 RepID=A0ABW5ND20_9FLAO|nr:copper chaperone PCu(A)C [Aquimarina sp. TRL1]QKX07333.1 copper chaperone PCu(A)C [Aquimarina sp. TRL1]
MATTSDQIQFIGPYAGQKNPGANSSAAFALVTNGGDEAINIIGWSSPTVPMVMPMYFGLDQNEVWSMIDVPSRIVNVSPGVPTLFAPGYLHIMLMNLQSELPESFDLVFTIKTESGTTFDKTVTFETVEWNHLIRQSVPSKPVL